MIENIYGIYHSRSDAELSIRQCVKDANLELHSKLRGNPLLSGQPELVLNGLSLYKNGEWVSYLTFRSETYNVGRVGIFPQ